MKKLIHPVAGTVAILSIASFWLSTALTELLGSKSAIIAVKTAIPWGFVVLIPALIAVGATGFALSKGRRVGLIATKLKRMPLIAANGVLVLIPSALFLASKARAGEFDRLLRCTDAGINRRRRERRSAQSQHARWPQNEGLVQTSVGVTSTERGRTLTKANSSKGSRVSARHVDCSSHEIKS